MCWSFGASSLAVLFETTVQSLLAFYAYADTAFYLVVAGFVERI